MTRIISRPATLSLAGAHPAQADTAPDAAPLQLAQPQSQPASLGEVMVTAPTFFFGSTNFDSQYGTRGDAWAPFRQVDFHATDRLTLSAGARYTEEFKALDRSFGTCTTPTRSTSAPASAASPTPGSTTPSPWAWPAPCISENLNPP